MAMPTLQQLRTVAALIKPHITATPVITRVIDGRTVYFKAELLQPTGSFKVRGACASIIAAKAGNPELKGVVTHSSGNHGAAVAWAAKKLGVAACIVVPSNAPATKLRLIEAQQAELVLCEPSPAARAETCDKIAAERGYYFVAPFNSYNTMSGQASIALELLDEFPEVEAIVAPASGGGMIGGIALGASYVNPACKVFAAEPEGKQLGESLAAGEPLWDPTQFVPTKCDALRMQPGDISFAVLQKFLQKQVFTVTDDEAAAAMRYSWEDLKLCCELSSGIGIAALKQLPSHIKSVAVIVCGGNCDLDNPPWLS